MERPFKFERLFFKHRGQKLLGALWVPSGTGERPPGVLLLHGFPGMAPIMNELASSLCQEGFAPMIFHYRGCWGSGGRYSFLGALDDAQNALEILAQRQDLASDRIAVVGHSFGGLAAIHAAIKSEKVRVVVALCPLANMKEGLASSRKTILEARLPFVSGLTLKRALQEWEVMSKRYDPVYNIDKISPRPFLLVHGDQDDVIPKSCSTRLFSGASEPKEMFVVNGADHIFAGKQRLVVETTVNWLRSSLAL